MDFLKRHITMDSVTEWASELFSTRHTGFFVIANIVTLGYFCPSALFRPVFLSWLVLAVVTLIRHFVINRPSACVPARNTSVLITGCSTGFGKLSALDIVARGVPVFACVRKQADADALLIEAKNSPLLIPLIVDVTNVEQISAAVATVAAALESRQMVLGSVINNSGYGLFGQMASLAMPDFEAQIAVNVTGSLRITQAFLPMLKAAGQSSTAAGGNTARLVFVSSVGGEVSIPQEGAYHMSKFAVEAMSDAMRVELKPFSIDVVCIQPGGFRTAFTSTLAKSADSDFVSLIGKATRNLPDPSPVISAYARACFERVPLSRYVVGFDAIFGIGWFADYSDAVRDFVFTTILRFVRKSS